MRIWGIEMEKDVLIINVGIMELCLLSIEHFESCSVTFDLEDIYSSQEMN